jgi:uncharacterized protein (TIGR00369 family)
MSFDGITGGSTVGRYLGIELHETGAPDGERPPVVEGSLPVTPGASSPAGGLSAAALLAAADSVAGLCAGLAALPRWVVSTNLHLRVARPAHHGLLLLSSRTLRVGRDAVVTDATIREAATGETVAFGLLTSSALAPPDGPPALRRPVSLRPPDEPGASELAWTDFFAIEPLTGDGDRLPVARLELRDHLRNPWGILHGGALAALADAAAVQAARRLASVNGHVTGCALHFLRPARIGPVDAHARLVGGSGNRLVVRLSLVDVGAQREAALVTATVTPLPSSG